MKDILIIDKVKQETVIQANQKQEYKHIGKIILRPGLSLFQLNMKTGKCEKVELKRNVNMGFSGTPEVETKVLFNPDCIYTTALNKRMQSENSLKIFNHEQGFKV